MFGSFGSFHNTICKSTILAIVADLMNYYSFNTSDVSGTQLANKASGTAVYDASFNGTISTSDTKFGSGALSLAESTSSVIISNATTPFTNLTTPPISNICTYCITNSGNRMVFGRFSDQTSGFIYFSNYSGSAWGPITQTNISNTLNITNVVATDSGSRIVISTYGGLCYHSVWSDASQNYSEKVAITDTTGYNYCGLDITGDGSRIFTILPAGGTKTGVWYADWNSGTSKYGAWIQGPTQTGVGIGCSKDGLRIVYGDESNQFYYATRNGSAYVHGGTLPTLPTV